MESGMLRGRDEEGQQRSLSPSTRMVPQMQVSPSLVNALDHNDDFFHKFQQSNKMLRDNSRRTRLSQELQRRSVVDRLLAQGVEEDDIPPLEIDVDSSDITVTMQIYNGEFHDLCHRKLPDSLWSIMTDTKTQIRFPDRDESGYFQCQVSISGKMPDVEKARERLRGMCCLSITFSAEKNKLNYGLNELDAWIQQQYKENNFPSKCGVVRVVAPQHREYFNTVSINVTGTLSDETDVLADIKMITERLFEPVVLETLQFRTELTVPMSQMEMYLGGEKAGLLLAVAKYTNACLHFHPNPHPKLLYHHFLITGKPEAVIIAYKVLLALQPVQLTLNARKNDLCTSFARGTSLKILDDSVHVNICPSALQPATGLDHDPVIHFLCLTAQEHNIGSCYDVLLKYLRRDNPIVNNVPRVPVPSFMQPILAHIGVIAARYLDILNRNHPISTLSPVAVDCEAVIPVVECETVDFPDTESVQEEFGRRDYYIAGHGDTSSGSDQRFFSGNNSYYGSYRDDRGGRRYGNSSRSSIDGRHEGGASYGNRPYTRQFNNSNRPFRGGHHYRQNNGDKRPSHYGGRMSNGGGNRYPGPPRDRETNVKSELQLKARGSTYNGDRSFSSNGDHVSEGRQEYQRRDHVSEGRQEYQRRDHDFNRRDGRDKWHRNYGGPRHQTEGSHFHHRENYFVSNAADWRRNSDNKVFLRNRSPTELHQVPDVERDVASPNELSRRMNAMDLIMCASEQSPVYVMEGDKVVKMRTYADVLEGNKRGGEQQLKRNDSSQEAESDNARNARPARRSYSMACVPSSPTPQFAPYPSYSPFASGARFLDRRVDVDHVLFSLNCTKYIENFRKANIKDLETFSMLTEKDLERLGVTTDLDRETIHSYAIRLRNGPPPVSGSRSGPSICA